VRIVTVPRWTVAAALAAVLGVSTLAQPRSRADLGFQQATATVPTPVKAQPAADSAASGTGAQPLTAPGLSIRITSPLGRTGVSGSVRLVARVTVAPTLTLSPVQFFVDGKLVGEGKSGPPYAVDWNDDNPYEAREIVAQVSDDRGGVARDVVDLKPLEVRDTSSVASVLLEPMVLDADGKPVNGLKLGDFHVLEDGVPQAIEMADPEIAPSTYTLLIDSSQSMSRRLDFVREAAARLPQFLRPDDEIVVAPFTRKLGTVTGPTKDRQTIADAIGALHATGGTSILDCLKDLGPRLAGQTTRQIVVLITDGYDEDSTTTFQAALQAIKSSEATLYVVGIGGVAGISIKGEDLLRQLATETGGRAFFPAREEQIADVHELISADVQDRYMVSYTPTNQKADGTWRSVLVATNNPTYHLRVRSGYRAASPPPVQPQIELTLRDTNRGFVDVGADDLQVFEDGAEQKIEGFEEAVTPVSVVLALDGSGSMKKSAEGVKSAAESFVNALPDKDSLGVLQFADHATLVQDLSKDRKHAIEAVGDYVANGGTALYDALMMSLERLRRAEGRRVVVVLTDGVDENNPGTAPGSVHTLDDVRAALKDTGATVFAIGLGTKVDHTVLDDLAQVSGGESYFPEDVTTLDANYHRILENLRRRYIISYTSTNFARDGAWRRVEIRCRRAGIVVQSQGGFFAPNGG
jgi:Ca-activated chloride channel family protein